MIPQNVLVLERKEEGVADALVCWLKRHPLPGSHGSLIVLAPRWAAAPEGEPEWLPPCNVLLLPGAEGALAARLRTECAVSYGSGVRDSLTISSVEGEGLAVAVQRELPTLLGGAVEEQELVLPARRAWSPLPSLAIIGALLVLGAPPELIMEDPPLL